MTKTTGFDLKKTTLNFVLPVLISAAVIYIFFKDISLTDIKLNFLKIPLTYLTAFVLLSLAGTVLRALKYHVLLSKKLRFWDIFLITLVRNFSVDLLPARTASLVFYSWFTKKKGIALEEGASSFVVSVFYDALALSVMLGGLVFFLETGVDRWAIYTGMGLIFVISIIMIFFAEGIIRFALKLKLIKRFPKLTGFLTHIDEYLSQHKKNSERLYVFFLSLVIRIIKYVFIYILFEGVVKIGFSPATFATFSFMLAVTEMSALIPIQGLGGFGTWELAFLFTFKLFFKDITLSDDIIKSAAFVIHITTQVWEYSIGLAAFLYLFLKKPRTNTEDTDEKHDEG
jgi:uncharacterized membrane protein YbhN (UPF0104 family)